MKKNNEIYCKYCNKIIDPDKWVNFLIANKVCAKCFDELKLKDLNKFGKDVLNETGNEKKENVAKVNR